ncbi:MAG: SlyX family protein [Planctomycetales bacterium]|nr:SlyX family protein [Planctomycetales bacterium]
MTPEERIVELETRFTHQQRMLEDLSAVLIEQGRQLEEAERAIGRLLQRTDELGAQLDTPRRAEEERPPHY